MPGSTCCRQRTAPHRLTFMTSRYIDGGHSSATALPPTPALLTNTSTRPSVSAEDLREPVAHRLVVGDVELDEVDLDAGLGRHRLQLAGLVEAADRAVHGVALLGEMDGGGAADAAVGAGDDGDGHAVMVSRGD